MPKWARTNDQHVTFVLPFVPDQVIHDAYPKRLQPRYLAHEEEYLNLEFINFQPVFTTKPAHLKIVATFSTSGSQRINFCPQPSHIPGLSFLVPPPLQSSTRSLTPPFKLRWVGQVRQCWWPIWSNSPQCLRHSECRTARRKWIPGWDRNRSSEARRLRRRGRGSRPLQ